MSTSDIGAPTRAPLHLAVALDGAGWHPGARHDPGARPADPSTARYWTSLVETAERGLLDLVTVEDEPDSRNHALRVAALVAPSTSRIGLVPALTATDPAPLSLAAALAALDHDSLGRRRHVDQGKTHASLSARPSGTGDHRDDTQETTMTTVTTHRTTTTPDTARQLLDGLEALVQRHRALAHDDAAPLHAELITAEVAMQLAVARRALRRAPAIDRTGPAFVD